MTPKQSVSEAAQVEEYMRLLDHPLKREIEMLREMIKSADSRIRERIKWNAPSYYYEQDLLTFGPPARKKDEILLVFHHPSIVHIPSSILTGNYPDRRLTVFKSPDQIMENREELQRIIKAVVAGIDA